MFMCLIVDNDFFYFPVVPTILSQSNMFDDTQISCRFKLNQVFRASRSLWGFFDSLCDFYLKTSLSVISCFQISFEIVVEPTSRIKLKPFRKSSILSLQLDFNFIIGARFMFLCSYYFNFVTICIAFILNNSNWSWVMIHDGNLRWK